MPEGEPPHAIGAAFTAAAADARGKVSPVELDAALRIETALTWQALTTADATLSSLAAGRG